MPPKNIKKPEDQPTLDKFFTPLRGGRGSGDGRGGAGRGGGGAGSSTLTKGAATHEMDRNRTVSYVAPLVEGGVGGGRKAPRRDDEIAEVIEFAKGSVSTTPKPTLPTSGSSPEVLKRLNVDEGSWPTMVIPRADGKPSAGKTAMPPVASATSAAAEPSKKAGTGGGAPPPSAATTGGGGGSRAAKGGVCWYFIKEGGCREGSRCSYKHVNDFGYGVVKMPWSEQFTFISETTKKECSAWKRTQAVLGEPTNTITDLEELLLTLPKAPSGKKVSYPNNFVGLINVLEKEMAPETASYFLTTIVPWMKSVVHLGPSLFPKGVPLLLRRQPDSEVRLTQAQVCCLLCCSFFGLMPLRTRMSDSQRKNESYGNREDAQYQERMPYCNFANLFAQDDPSSHAKMICLIQYFVIMCKNWSAIRARKAGKDERYIQVVRCSLPDNLPPLEKCKAKLKLPIEMLNDGLIEEANGMVQADFANANLGGGVLGRGCVQEEIRMTLCPELLLSRILCDRLGPRDAVIINGAQQFAKGKGYAKSFRFNGYHPLAPASAPSTDGVLNVSVVAFDATNYNSGNLQPDYQYLASWITHDTMKALAAFRGSRLSTLVQGYNGTIATGNWGCGAFGGDPQLKLVLQLIAASAVGRSLRYYTFGNEKLVADWKELESKLIAKSVTVDQLFTLVVAFDAEAATGAPDADDEEELELLARTATVDALPSSLEDEAGYAAMLARMDTGTGAGPRTLFQHIAASI